MGVKGLWKLLEAAGKPIPVEKLENKILSIGILFQQLFIFHSLLFKMFNNIEFNYNILIIFYGRIFIMSLN